MSEEQRNASEALMKDDRLYFPNLNGLRFFAAFIVILNHLELMKDYYLGMESKPFLQNFNSGQLGVILFFTLSGFLITYLLLVEEKKTKTVSIKDFYIRRILRIWPLYYVLILLGFFVLRYISFFEIPYFPGSYSPRNFILYLLILPNVVFYGMGYVVPYISHTWSIGVEEQFYIIWPVLMKFIKKKQVLLIGVILLYFIIKFALVPFLLDVTQSYHVYVFGKIWNKFSISCMAIGGLFAFWHFKKNPIIEKLYNPVLNWCIILFLFLVFFTDFDLPYINNEFFGVVFGILILNLATNPRPVVNLENKVFNYLGKISYGLYMYHVIAIVAAVRLLAAFGIESWAAQITLSTGFTVLLASLSYYGLELRFIRMKSRFSKILSGDNVHDSNK